MFWFLDNISMQVWSLCTAKMCKTGDTRSCFLPECQKQQVQADFYLEWNIEKGPFGEHKTEPAAWHWLCCEKCFLKKKQWDIKFHGCSESEDKTRTHKIWGSLEWTGKAQTGALTRCQACVTCHRRVNGCCQGRPKVTREGGMEVTLIWLSFNALTKSIRQGCKCCQPCLCSVSGGAAYICSNCWRGNMGTSCCCWSWTAANYFINDPSTLSSCICSVPSLLFTRGTDSGSSITVPSHVVHTCYFISPICRFMGGGLS